MQNLKKVTSEFIETEDRIRLSALNTDNNTIAFWLTQRLLSRLISHLSKQLETDSTEAQNTQKGKPRDFSRSGRDETDSNEVRNTQKSEPQGFSHSGGDVAPQSPVKIEKSNRPILITEVDIKFGNNGLILILKSETESRAAISFTLSELKQWLDILYSLWHKAGWPISQLPQSLTNNNSVKEVSTNTIH